MYDENVRMFEFGRTYRRIEPDSYYRWRGQVWHVCVVVGNLDEIGRPLPNSIVYDINGGRAFKDMPQYLTAQYSAPIDSNYAEDLVCFVNDNEYIIEDSVTEKEMHKFEILREEDGIIEECYYDFLSARKGDCKERTPFFALFKHQTEEQTDGEM